MHLTLIATAALHFFGCHFSMHPSQTPGLSRLTLVNIWYLGHCNSQAAFGRVKASLCTRIPAHLGGLLRIFVEWYTNAQNWPRCASGTAAKAGGFFFASGDEPLLPLLSGCEVWSQDCAKHLWIIIRSALHNTIECVVLNVS